MGLWLTPFTLRRRLALLYPYQKDRIRRVHIFQISNREKCGTPVITKYISSGENGSQQIPIDEEMRILDPYELVKVVEKELRKCYVAEIEPASPIRANIIVRVYQKRHYKYDWGEIYNLYGADCYARKWFRWYTECDGKLYPLKRKENPIKFWLFSDEYIIFDTDFIDIYFRGK